MDNSTVSSTSDCHVSETILHFCSLLIVVIGVPGNILMFIVFSHSPLLRLSVSMYFRAMALANLFININWIRKFFEFEYGFVLMNQSQFLCKATLFPIYVTGSLAAWLMVAANLDRFLVIVYPNRLQFIRKKPYPLGIVIFIFIYNIIFYFQILINGKLTPNTASSDQQNSTIIELTCDLDDYVNSVVFYTSDMINSTLLPFFITIVSTFCTLIAVHNSHRRMQKFDHSTHTSHRKIRDLKFGVTMIITNVAFLVFTAPYALYILLISNENYNDQISRIFLFMFYLFYTMDFYLQLAVNSLVKKQFISLLIKVMMKAKLK